MSTVRQRDHVTIACLTVPGLGAALSWHVVVEGQSNANPLSSYAAPIVSSVMFMPLDVGDPDPAHRVPLRPLAGASACERGDTSRYLANGPMYHATGTHTAVTQLRLYTCTCVAFILMGVMHTCHAFSVHVLHTLWPHRGTHSCSARCRQAQAPCLQ